MHTDKDTPEGEVADPAGSTPGVADLQHSRVGSARVGDPLATWNSGDANSQSSAGHCVGIMRCGQRVGETLADEIAPAAEQGFRFGQPFEYDALYANDRSETPSDDKGAAVGTGEAS